jgi:NodT family efflux transporter outer membrane factor (OMF) lipoprotein
MFVVTHRRRRSCLLAATVAGLLAGCAVGPDFQSPKPPDVARMTPQPLPAQTVSAPGAFGAPQRFVPAMDIPAEWWTLFGSPQLSARVQEALKNNPNIAAAQAALTQAKELADAQRGFYFPNVSANFDASRNKTATGTLSPASASGNPYYSVITPQVFVSFTPDVFGLNQRTVESLDAQAENQGFQNEATFLTLTSNVVTAAIQEANLRGQIDATQQVVKVESDLMAILRRQGALGQVAGADIATQEAALAQAQALLPPLAKQLAQEKDLEAALLGRFPSDAPSDQFTLAQLTLPRDVPVSLPSQVVAQRPDVRAAEATLHAATAQVGVAIANRLPQISLTANLGDSAPSFATLFGSGTAFGSLAASLTQPLFDGFTLMHRQRAAEAALAQAMAQYKATVITAFQNVADALQALDQDARALQAAVAAEAAAARSLTIARTQFDLGAVAYLSLLNAQQTYQQAVVNLVQAQANRLSDTAALFQAAGGAWWQKDVVAQQ